MPPFIAHLEPIAAIIRVYAADAPPPAPYIMAMAMTADQGSAEIKGLSTEALTHAHYAAVKRCLASRGYHTMWWTRKDPATGEMRRVSVATGLAADDASVNHG